MSLPLQHILRLPSCLRSQAFLSIQHAMLPGLRHEIRRSFSRTSTLSKVSKPVQRPPTRPSAPPPTLSRPSAAPPPSPPKPRRLPSYADVLLRNGDEVLLYKAPSHRSFRITCYVLGGTLLAGAFNWVAVLQQPPPGTDPELKEKQKPGLLLMTSTVIATLMTGVIATAIILAPTRMVRTVTLRGVRASLGGENIRTAMLSCELESELPFLEPRIIEVEPSQAYMDREVQAVDIDLTSRSLDDAQKFTATAGSPAVAPSSAESQGLLGRTASTITRDVRRMFYRDGIAYLRMQNHGNLKLDLQHCELLEWGTPLDRLTTVDLARGVGPMSWLMRQFGYYSGK